MSFLRRLLGWGPAGRSEAPAAPAEALQAPIPVLTVGEAPGASLATLLRAAGFAEAEAWAVHLAEPMRRHGIAGARRVAAFLATTGHESAGGTRLAETMRYSARRLTEVWPARFPTLDAARPFAWDPADPDREDVALANLTYGARMGNGRNGTADDDGWLYRGRGLVMLTGANGYAAAADALSLPLLTAPDLAAEPGPAAEIAAWWWAWRGCNALADGGEVKPWRRRVNGGLIGIGDVTRRYHAVLSALGAARPAS